MKRCSEEGVIIGMKTGIERVWIVLPLLLLLLAGTSIRGLADDGGPVNPDPEGARNRVAARVNGAEITEKYVTMTMNRMHAGMGRGHAASEATEEMRKRALNLLILQELAWQKADGKMDREPVKGKIASMKARAGGEEEYRNMLEKEGLTEGEAVLIVEKGIVFDRMLEKEVLSRATVSEDDLRKEYEKEKERFHTPEKVEVVDVVFFLETGEKESMRRAEEIRRRIADEEGNNPLRLAPDGTFIVREIEVRKEKEGKLYEEARKLEVDELSGVITTPDSLHILRLKKITPEKQYTFDQAKGSLEGNLKREAVQKRMQEWEAELKRGATIEIPGTAGGRKQG
jgi:PPIC-type PPIASE domain/SurA N-terminal domain